MLLTILSVLKLCFNIIGVVSLKSSVAGWSLHYMWESTVQSLKALLCFFWYLLTLCLTLFLIAIWNLVLSSWDSAGKQVKRGNPPNPTTVKSFHSDHSLCPIYFPTVFVGQQPSRSLLCPQVLLVLASPTVLWSTCTSSAAFFKLVTCH